MDKTRLNKIWVISDTHFNHTNIIKYCNRPFKDANHMNESLIANWNAKVSPDDDVIHCGDFCFGNPLPIINRLNGRITLVKGNHDQSFLKMMKYNQDPNLTDKVRVLDTFGIVSNEKKVLFIHYPIWQDRYSHNHVYDLLLYGHVHNGHEDLPGPVNTKNICVEKMNYEPQELDVVVKSML